MKAALIALLTLSLVTAGCSSVRVMTPGATPAAQRQQLQPGDRVKVHLKSGSVRELRISAIDAETLTGEEGKGASAATVQIAMSDIQRVEYRRASGFRTAGLVVLLTAVAVAATPQGRYLFQCVFNEECGD